MLQKAVRAVRASAARTGSTISAAKVWRGPLITFLLGQKADQSISDIGTGREKWIGPLLLGSTVLLGLGLVLPVVRVTEFFIFADALSIADGILSLWRDGEYLLAAVVLLFSAVFPYYKLDQAYRLWRRTNVHATAFDKRLRRIGWLSKWSMVDVLVIALFVFSIKATGVADARSEYGLYFFVGAIAGTAVSLAWIKSAAVRLRNARAVHIQD